MRHDTLIGLSDYVLKRNGVPLGHPKSMTNMLARSLGAKSFDQFWVYWNPIWGYYLGYRIYRPLQKIVPAALALILTFAVSGFVHDIAISLFKFEPVVLFTPWFSFMGITIVVCKRLGVSFGQTPWLMRAAINVAIIYACYLLAIYGSRLNFISRD